MRSVWKAQNDFCKVSNLFRNRMKLSEVLLNKRTTMYNGRSFTSFIVRDHMINSLPSKFIISKFTGKRIHIKKKKRRRK